MRVASERRKETAPYKCALMIWELDAHTETTLFSWLMNHTARYNTCRPIMNTYTWPCKALPRIPERGEKMDQKVVNHDVTFWNGVNVRSMIEVVYSYLCNLTHTSIGG